MRDQRRFHPVSIFLHWLIFLLFAATLAIIEYRGDLPKGDALKGPLISAHMQIGVLIFVLAWVRLFVRRSVGVPPEAQSPAWQQFVAKLVKVLLYAVMFLVPLLGVLFVQAEDKAVTVLGWTLPSLIAAVPHSALQANLEDAHKLLGNLVYFLVGLHVLGALWHHFVLRDDVLRRMLPRRWSR